MSRSRFLRACLSAAVVAALLVLNGDLASAAPAPSAPRTMAAAQDAGEPGELEIGVDADGYQLLETVPAGWYIVTLDNTTEEDVVADLVLLPEGKTADDLQRSLSTGSGASTVPDWFEQVVFAGGPSAPPQSRAQTLVELTPGVWTILQVGEVGGHQAELVVAEADGDVLPPNWNAAVEMTFGDGTIEMPNEVDNGERVWRVVNADTHTHGFALIKLPVEIGRDELMTLLTQGIEPEGVDVSETIIVGGIGLLSGGRSIWTGFDLEPGHYVALDYVPTADGRTHAELGQVALFTVK